MLARCRPKASTTASTSQLTIEQSIRRSATMAWPVRTGTLEQAGRRTEWKSRYRWAPFGQDIAPLPSSRSGAELRRTRPRTEPPTIRLLKTVADDPVALLRLTDSVVDHLAPSETLSREFLRIRLEAIIANEAYDRLASIDDLFSRCPEGPDSALCNLALQGALSASNVAGAKQMYQRSVAVERPRSRTGGDSLDRQIKLHLGYRAAGSGMAHVRQMMRAARTWDASLAGAEKLAALWIEMHVKQGFYRFCELLVRRFDWRGFVELPDIITPSRTGGKEGEGEGYKSHRVTGSLRVTAEACVAAMKLYNALSRSDVVQRIWASLLKFHIVPTSACLEELLKSLPLPRALDELGRTHLLSSDLVAALLPTIADRYGEACFPVVLEWMAFRGLRPTPRVLQEMLLVLSRDESTAPASLIRLCQEAVDSSEGALVLSDSHAVILLEHAAGWAEACVSPVTASSPRRASPRPGEPVLSLADWSPVATVKGPLSKPFSRQTSYIETLRAGTLSAPKLQTLSTGTVSHRIDLGHPDLGMASLVGLLDRIYVGAALPSARSVAAMLRLGALGGMSTSDLLATFRDKVASRGLTRSPDHLHPIIVSTLPSSPGSSAGFDFGRAFRSSGTIASRIHVIWAGAMVALFITSLVAAGQPLRALALFRQAEHEDASRLNPSAYSAAVGAAAAAGDVGEMKRLHEEMNRRYGGTPGEGGKGKVSVKDETVYLLSLFETLMRLQEPEAAQREALLALTTCHAGGSVAADGRVVRAIMDSGRKMRRTRARLVRLKEGLEEKGRRGGEFDGTNSRWQSRHVAERIASLDRALDTQQQVERLAKDQMARLPPSSSEGEKAQSVKRLGELARVPAWFKWAEERQKIEREGGVRKGLHGMLEEMVLGRRRGQQE